MYTSGVTKIFINRNEKNNLKDTEILAVSSGYHALSFKGDIYVRLTKSGWIKSPFRLIDFTAEA
ncbi:hypothetical protein NVP1162O_48 [Vibrio phage 1.162.O._10N.261.48.E3]|nr:hypothetical protein NVP1147O_48 [Vibrio phage 1.147.O._10N.286.49.E9]AUR91718.1 hypothetical protein NVP1162O_48 [Vibrio phage 1.162.O._10N.261.48.E3]AUR97479.1 hypothetical protein NVP1239O_43 [Vibrio phage 1.239.O._10N.261.52.F6]